jgi:hypothetical protein
MNSTDHLSIEQTRKMNEKIRKFIKFGKKYNREALDYRKVFFGVLDVGSLDQDYVLENYLNKFGELFFEDLDEGKILMVGPKRDNSHVNIEFLNANIMSDEEAEEHPEKSSETPEFTFDNLNVFIDNFFDNKYREVMLKSELRHLVDSQTKSCEYLERFNARSLSKLMNSSDWETNQMILICRSDEDINCKLAIIFMRFLKQTNPHIDLNFGFIDETKNHIDPLFKDSDLSPRFYLVNKKRRYRPEFYNREFGYESFVNWINEMVFSGDDEFKIKFNEIQQDELLLKIAETRGDYEEVKKAVELRKVERELKEMNENLEEKIKVDL